MIRSEKKLKDLASIINKDNNILISEAIEHLRDEQPFEGAIALLTSYYNKTDDFPVRKSIEGFMNDLKDQSVCGEVITEIRKQWKADTISMLVSSCWQSGLNYSEYTYDLAEVFLKSEFITALECLTVIEESAAELSRDQKDVILKLINEFPPSPIHEKKSLTQELIAILV